MSHLRVAIAVATGTAPGDWTDLRDILTAVDLIEERNRAR